MVADVQGEVIRVSPGHAYLPRINMGLSRREADPFQVTLGDGGGWWQGGGGLTGCQIGGDPLGDGLGLWPGNGAHQGDDGIGSHIIAGMKGHEILWGQRR